MADGLGEQIGVCGNGADSGDGFAIYEVAGDENRAVLYTEPRKYYFGSKDARLWLREDVFLGLPTAEMVSYITIICDKKEDVQTQTDDNSMVALMYQLVLSQEDRKTLPQSQQNEQYSVRAYRKSGKTLSII